jgi:hypothetical protein
VSADDQPEGLASFRAAQRARQIGADPRPGHIPRRGLPWRRPGASTGLPSNQWSTWCSLRPRVPAHDVDVDSRDESS